jgi:hypothetical protein
MSELTTEVYDTILDALDNENIELLQKLFAEYNLTPYMTLYDAPREGFNDQLLITYLDYVLSFGLTNILDFLIDNIGIEIDDNLIAKTLELQNFDTYNYILSLGYIPQIETLRIAVHNCYSEITDNILAVDNELVHELIDDDIEYLFSFDIDEETVETIHVLFNYGINPDIFIRFLKALKDPNDRYFPVSENETDYAIEIIAFLEQHGVITE